MQAIFQLVWKVWPYTRCKTFANDADNPIFLNGDDEPTSQSSHEPIIMATESDNTESDGIDEDEQTAGQSPSRSIRQKRKREYDGMQA